MTTEPQIRPQIRTVRIGWTSALLAAGVVVGFIVLRGAFVAAHRILGWTAAAVAVAVFVEPIVEWLGQWIPRVVAVLLTFLVIAGAVGGLVFTAFDELDTEVARLRDVMPPAIEQLEARDDELGRIATEIDLSRRADTFLDEVDQRIGSGSGALAENAPTLPVYFVSAILTLFLLVYGPAIARGAADQLGDDHRDVVLEVAVEASRRAQRTVSALLAQGAVVGIITGLAAWVLDLPAPIVLGLLAGIAGMLPDVGILLGTFPTVALAAALEGVRIAAVVLMVAVLVQLFEAIVVRRKIASFGVDVGPSVVWIVALVGFTIYGPGMAFYGAVYAIFTLSVLDQVPAIRDR